VNLINLFPAFPDVLLSDPVISLVVQHLFLEFAVFFLLFPGNFSRILMRLGNSCPQIQGRVNHPPRLLGDSGPRIQLEKIQQFGKECILLISWLAFKAMDRIDDPDVFK